MSSSTAASVTAERPASSRQERAHYRLKLNTLAYVNLDNANGGVVRDLSQGGAALQVLSPLRVHQQVQLRLQLDHPRVRLNAAGRVAWADPSGQAGIEFHGLALRQRRSLQQWCFAQLLGFAYQLSLADSVFDQPQRIVEPGELSFSAAPRPAIRLGERRWRLASAFQAGAMFASNASTVFRVLAWLTDVLIVGLGAVLFLIIARHFTRMEIGSLLRAGPVYLGDVILAGTYWLCFRYWRGATPGARLVQLVFASSWKNSRAEQRRPRFR